MSNCFAKGSDSKKIHVNNFNDFKQPIAVYGYLRGTGEAIKKSNNFWYIDHGYFKQSSRSFQNNRTIVNSWDGYFRVVHNDFWHSGLGNFPADRLKKLKLEFKDQKKKGDYIILSEPTIDAQNFYNLHDWTNITIKKIKKYSDRKIIVHNRYSKTPLKKLLENAWAFVSDHSSAGFLSMLEGVPAIFTNSTLENIGKLENIESIPINYQVFNNLAYGQWSYKEIYEGEAWKFLSKNLIK